MYRPGALSGITGLKQGGSLWEQEEKKTGVSSSNIPRRSCLVSPSYFSSPGTYTFRKSLPAPGKPRWSKAEEKSSFLFAQGYPKTEPEKKSVHGKIKTSAIYHCYFIKQISFVTLGTLLNLSGPQFLFYKSDTIGGGDLNSCRVMATKETQDSASIRFCSICKRFFGLPSLPSTTKKIHSKYILLVRNFTSTARQGIAGTGWKVLWRNS